MERPTLTGLLRLQEALELLDGELPGAVLVNGLDETPDLSQAHINIVRLEHVVQLLHVEGPRAILVKRCEQLLELDLLLELLLALDVVWRRANQVPRLEPGVRLLPLELCAHISRYS